VQEGDGNKAICAAVFLTGSLATAPVILAKIGKTFNDELEEVEVLE